VIAELRLQREKWEQAETKQAGDKRAELKPESSGGERSQIVVANQLITSGMAIEKREPRLDARINHSGLFCTILAALRNDNGSAVVEFVILAIPLFLPIVIYLSAIYQHSTIQSDLGELSRQAARAYVTSPSADFESARMEAVLATFEAKILQPQGVVNIPTLSITCENTPCLTPSSRVEITASLVTPPSSLSGIFRFLSTQGENYSQSDTQVVDAWR